MIRFRLVSAGAVAMLCAAAFASPVPAATGTDTSAGVIVGITGHVVVERKSASPKTATLGMRLDAVDVVVVDRGAMASIYLKGGGVVRLPADSRFEMPKASDAPSGDAPAAKLKSGTIAQLESGLWVLNDPGGSLLVSPMRGDAGFESSDVTVPLSPRYEALTAPLAAFLWTGGPAKARVVVARKREIVWRSAPAHPGAILEAGTGLKLAPGEVYTWWLEPEAGGPPLTAGIPFRIADAELIERTKAIEAELRPLADTADGAAAANYLLLAHYAGASSWTHVVELAGRLAPSDARTRAFAAAAEGLRLDQRTAETLAARLAAGSKR